MQVAQTVGSISQSQRQGSQAIVGASFLKQGATALGRRTLQVVVEVSLGEALEKYFGEDTVTTLGK